MKERPILFNGEMVRAILSGRKTQTRRVMLDQPCYLPDFNRGHLSIRVGGARYQAFSKNFAPVSCPFGRPGDRLWVRETWCPIYPQNPTYNGGRPIEIDYRATHSRESHWRVMDDHGTRRWKPSIHMPRWASRITLEITGVRVERLNDISHDDACTEGIESTRGGKLACVDRFRSLWEQSYGAGSWAANPWVWVVEFRRI